MSEEASQTAIPAEERRLLAGMEPRIARSTWIIGIAGTVVFWLVRGGSWAVGFGVGAALAALNFRWMKGGVNAIASQVSAASAVSEGQQRPDSGGAVARFVLRYALIALAGYAIFRSSAQSLPAFFAGLFVAIAAVFAEVGWQIWLALFAT